MNKQIEITMALSTIEKRILDALKNGNTPHSQLIAKTIVENLDTTEMGLSQLLLSFMGIEETCAWAIGDECLVHLDKLSSWRMEKEEMKSWDKLHKGHVKGKITEIDLRKKRAITFEFDGLYKSSGNLVSEVKKLEERVTVDIIKRDADLLLMRPDVSTLI